MKSLIHRILSLLILSLSVLAVSANDKLPYWKDVNVIGVNKEAPRTTFMSYENKNSALSSIESPYLDYTKSPYFYLLNGTWKFYYVDAYGKLPANITDPAVNTSSWNNITVPGNWELQGFGDAIYVNQQYEFNSSNPVPPILPETTPVGVYRRDIEIPSAWLNRDIYLHIAGAKSGVYVYVNGKEVGYSENSKDPAEFLITPYVQAGKNVLTLKIFRWSTGSWLECQDFFRMSGIERDIFIWSQPKTAIQDFRVVSTLDESFTKGILKLEMDLKNASGAHTAKYELLDPNNKLIAQGSQTMIQTGRAHFEYTVENVNTWTAENPNLYKLLMYVEENGQTQEVVPFRIGFRKIEIKDSGLRVGRNNMRLFYFNGQPIKLKGANIHETVQTGHYLIPEVMRRNFELMQLNNINSVRLSHYPQDRKFYEMCDYFGLYVYDEANIESHGMYYTIYNEDMQMGAVGHQDGRKKGTLGHNPDYLESHLSRLTAMFERNKNYPSITIWSMGNEAGNGFNFYNGYRLLKDLDKDLMNRPVCYERSLREWNTDMIVPQYPSTGSFENAGKEGTDRPYVPSEYSHAMGNSSGNLTDQWEQIYKYPNLQGGYIWEWIDHAVLAKDKNGKEFWAYGGDFGKDLPSDGNFVADGIVNPDQNPHPAMAEVKYSHQNVAFEAVDLNTGEIKIKNRFYFSNLSEYDVRYSIYENEKKIKEASLTLSLAPQEETIEQIPIANLKAKPGAEYFINFEVKSKKAKDLVPAGHVIAYDQFILPVQEAKTIHKNTNGPRLTIEESAGQIKIESSKVAFVFDKQKSIVTSYRVEDTEYFTDGFGIQPNFWRGPTDNDYGNGAPQRLQIWKQSSKNFQTVETQATMEGNTAVLSVNYLLGVGNNYIIRYNVYPNGIVNTQITFTSAGDISEREAVLSAEAKEFTVSDASQSRANRYSETAILEVPRIGVRFHIPAIMNQVQYFGRGPEENYLDRNKGTLIGLYKTTVEDMYYPYVRPQENGHHTDTRWVALNTGNGKGLLIEADNTIGFNALRNTVEDFDCEESDADYQWRNLSSQEIANKNVAGAKNVMRKQTHEYDIQPRNFVEVCVDMKQYGVAGFNSWGARPLPTYTIYANQEYNWGFTLIPINSTSEITKKKGFSY